MIKNSKKIKIKLKKNLLFYIVKLQVLRKNVIKVYICELF